MPSSDAIPPTGEGYLRRVLRQGSTPFRYRSGVRTLLGMPASEDTVVGAAGMPPIEFTYALPQTLAAMTAPDSLVADRWVEAALNDLNGEEWTGLEHSLALSRQPPAIGASSPPHQVRTDGGGYNPENERDSAQRNPSTLRAGAVGTAHPPRSEQESPALAPKTALLQVFPVNAVPLPPLVNQAGELRSQAALAEPVGTSSRAPQDQEFSAQPADLTAIVPARTEPAAIQPSTTRQPASSALEPGQLQCMSPGTDLTHSTATEAPMPSQVTAPAPDEPSAAASGAGQPTVITISGISEPRFSLSTELSITKEHSPRDQASGVLPPAIGTSSPSHQVGADGVGYAPESEMGGTQQNSSTTRVGTVGAAHPPRSEQEPPAIVPKTALLQVSPVNAVPLPPLVNQTEVPLSEASLDGPVGDPGSAVRTHKSSVQSAGFTAVPAAIDNRKAGRISGFAPARVADTRVVQEPSASDNPPSGNAHFRPSVVPTPMPLADALPGIGITASADQPALSAAEQIARLRRMVAELAAQVAAQRDFQQQPTPLFHPPAQPVASVERPAPPTRTSHAFWERSYINRLYRWSRR